MLPCLGSGSIASSGRDMLNLLAYADGRHDMVDIAERIGAPTLACADMAKTLLAHGLVTRCDDPDKLEPV